MQCLQCQHENAADAKFCNQCGSPFAPVCAACGHHNTVDAKFCNQCGALLKAPADVRSSVPLNSQASEATSRFHAVLTAISAVLQRDRRLTYREVRLAFGLDDGLLEDIRKTLQFKRLAVDEDGEGLVWIGDPQPAFSAMATSPIVSRSSSSGVTVPSEMTTASPRSDASLAAPAAPAFARSAPEAERRQLTVMFCDLVGSTDLSGKLDPEDLREVVRAYQETAAVIVERYQGHIAQYLGDGLLIYFGFPIAHEDDAQRAVYTGLEMPEAIAVLNTRLEADYGVQLAVRIGIHTGPVVVGEIGGGARHENLALVLQRDFI